jgi:D-sedoheptulose 7-phosphate isomerase
MVTAFELAAHVEQSLLARNELFEQFFAREARRLADACKEMSERFLRGGRLLAFGRGPYATDAQHVSVEFVHPVIVGKRALPALDLSIHFHAWVEAIVTADDMVMGFGPPDGDPDVWAALEVARARGAMTFALPGRQGSYTLSAATADPFMHQELVEVLYHTLWETVHVFFEHNPQGAGHELGDTEFLYPYLGKGQQGKSNLVDDVAASIGMKVAADSTLRRQVVAEQTGNICAATRAIHERVEAGGKLILFGNGGSATDANDFAIDCIAPPPGWRSVPAVSLSLEPANVTAIANDVGVDVIFLRQLIAQARPEDVAIAISTSGGSRNVIAALEEARKRHMLTVALLGYDGGEIARREVADVMVVVQSDYIPRIQEVQASVYHVIREGLEGLTRGEG